MTALLRDALPPTQRRVHENTAAAVNEQNRQQTDRNVERFAAQDREAISRRIDELEREWDIERTLEANAAAVSLVSLTLGFFVSRCWYLLPTFVAAFLLQHALQGWCPPVSIFRRLGVRTESEIFEELTALRILRGDFTPTNKPGEALSQVRALYPGTEGK
jgi:hypothetical protein